MAASSPKSTDRPNRVAASAELTWRMVRREGRPTEIVAFEESVLIFFLDTASLLGVPKSLAAIYGILFASPEPLSFSEVKDRLNISAGSISQGLRVLREVGALKVITADLDSRELYTPDIELRKLARHYLENRVMKQLDSGRGRLQAIGKAVPEMPDGSGKVLKDRLKSLQNWHEKSRAVLPLVKTFLKLA